jgi:putative toxin-antitoxin system antitoxin component (TIGR02293 family)
MGHVREQAYDTLGSWMSLGQVRDHLDLAQIAEQGLPLSKFRRLKDKGLTDNELHVLVAPRRTLAHRQTKRQSLTKEESDRALRVAYIVAFARTVFGDDAKAMSWLRRPSLSLGNRTPLDLLGTEAGARHIEERLYAIDEGLYV